jgi:Leucine-rich repeat (LRR) protein
LKWKEKVVQQINEIISKPVEKKDKDAVKKIVSLPDTPLKVEEQASYAAVTEPMIKELKSQGIIAQVMDPTTQQLFINFVNVKQVEPTMFEVLYPIKDQIAGFRITNLVLNQEAMRSLFQFKNVEILQLSNAHLTDELVGLILQLPKLQQLNLYGNPVTDQTAMALHNVFSLKKVYVWQTNISPLALNELQKARPQLQIEGGSQLLTKPDSLKK